MEANKLSIPSRLKVSSRFVGIMDVVDGAI